MTSAARPTWSAALGSGGGLRDGSSAAPTLQTCAKDQPGHLKLKLRQIGQDAPEELRARDFRNENLDTNTTSSSRTAVGLISGDSDVEIEDSDSENGEKNTLERFNSDDDINESEAFEEDDDEEAELMLELEKIRRERESEKIAKERKAAEKDPHSVLAGNPLLATLKTSENEASSFGAKRRWDDDVVFKNQAKGIDEKPEKRFINDTTRSDFHRRFMDKFIK